MIRRIRLNENHVRKEFGSWRGGDKQKFGGPIAVRAALRVLPQITNFDANVKPEDVASLLIQAFRALYIAWLQLRQPNERPNFKVFDAKMLSGATNKFAKQSILHDAVWEAGYAAAYAALAKDNYSGSSAIEAVVSAFSASRDKAQFWASVLADQAFAEESRGSSVHRLVKRRLWLPEVRTTKQSGRFNFPISECVVEFIQEIEGVAKVRLHFLDSLVRIVAGGT